MKCVKSMNKKIFIYGYLLVNTRLIVICNVIIYIAYIKNTIFKILQNFV